MSSNADGMPHVLPLSKYFAVFGALCVLTIVTVTAAKADIGAWETPVAIGIACIKSVLVLLYFMHMRYSEHLIWIFAATAIVFFLILIGITMADFDTRPLVQPWNQG